MPRRLLLLNVLLGGVSVACAAFIAWELAAPWPSPPPRARAAAPAAPAPAPAPAAPPAAYNVVALRNVFSPARSEGPAAVTGGPAPFAAKPNLYGVVLRDQNPLAYLEDPLTRRVAAYRVGDAIAGGTLQTIDADRVVIARPEGPIDVRLRDPSKPRAPAAPLVLAPGAVPPGVVAPGTVPPGAGPPSIIVPGAPVPPSILVPGRPAPQLPPGTPGTGVGPFGFPGRRPSPSLGRPTPVPPITEAPPAPRQ